MTCLPIANNQSPKGAKTIQGLLPVSLRGGL